MNANVKQATVPVPPWESPEPAPGVSDPSWLDWARRRLAIWAAWVSR